MKRASVKLLADFLTSMATCPYCKSERVCRPDCRTDGIELILATSRAVAEKFRELESLPENEAPSIADELAPEWHKVLGAFMRQQKVDACELGAEEFSQLDGHMVVVGANDEGTRLTVRLVPVAEAKHMLAEYDKASQRHRQN